MCLGNTESVILGESQEWEVGMGNNTGKKFSQGYDYQINEFKIFFLWKMEWHCCDF